MAGRRAASTSSCPGTGRPPKPAERQAVRERVPRPRYRCTNPVLHGWLKERLEVILATMPSPAAPPDVAVTRRAWEAWQDGLAERFTLPTELPPLRILLVWDNLTGHKNAEMVVWLCQHGVMPLYTPLGGSWL